MNTIPTPPLPLPPLPANAGQALEERGWGEVFFLDLLKSIRKTNISTINYGKISVILIILLSIKYLPIK